MDSFKAVLLMGCIVAKGDGSLFASNCNQFGKDYILALLKEHQQLWDLLPQLYLSVDFIVFF